MSDFEAVLDFWFGPLDDNGFADSEHRARWFKKDPAFDAELRDRFGAEHEAIHAGRRETWLEDPRSRLAYIIVLDQFSRNMFRDTADMFASDELALRVAIAGIARGMDRRLEVDERAFYYLPLMHSESLDVQTRCVELFTQLRDELEGEARSRIDNNLEYAIRHREIIEKWGRFPHRNAVLGRASTPDESAFLRQPGSSF